MARLCKLKIVLVRQVISLSALSVAYLLVPLYPIWAASPEPPKNLRIVSDNGDSAPVAANDQYTAVEGRELLVPAPGVLVNDINPDADLLTVDLVSLPENGTLTIKADGSFGYISDADFRGNDSFTYRASNGRLFSNLATVLIKVVSAVALPWIEDSFEGEAPRGWSPQWNMGPTYAVHDTIDQYGAPPGGGQ